MPAKTCQYGNCLNDVGLEGVVVSLKAATPMDEKRAIYCCAGHAAASLFRLSVDRKEATSNDPIPGRWRTT